MPRCSFFPGSAIARPPRKPKDPVSRAQVGLKAEAGRKATRDVRKNCGKRVEDVKRQNAKTPRRRGATRPKPDPGSLHTEAPSLQRVTLLNQQARRRRSLCAFATLRLCVEIFRANRFFSQVLGLDRLPTRRRLERGLLRLKETRDSFEVEATTYEFPALSREVQGRVFRRYRGERL
ncbi:MAG: hypothetical protein BMS9Abin37_1336 [Acidobacteriota bacterium]|nr:MAG: hypothetical protein BMS9Abin37_1336 [Acidobacteriota bacterium]